MSDTFLLIHNQFFYLNSENQLEFLMIKILGDDSKSIFNKKKQEFFVLFTHTRRSDLKR
jgi:hypothetical protein